MKEVREGAVTPGVYYFSEEGYLVHDGDVSAKLTRDTLEEKVRRTMQTGEKRALTYYYPTPEEFLDQWWKGYEDFKLDEGGYVEDNRSKGFVLSVIDWDEKVVARSSINGIQKAKSFVLAADMNGIYDQIGHMRIGINHIGKRKSLVWSAKENNKLSEFDQFKDAVKYFRDNIGFSPLGANTFPFEDPNPLKSVAHSWTMVGIEYERVYAWFASKRFR